MVATIQPYYLTVVLFYSGQFFNFPFGKFVDIWYIIFLITHSATIALHAPNYVFDLNFQLILFFQCPWSYYIFDNGFNFLSSIRKISVTIFEFIYSLTVSLHAPKFCLVEPNAERSLFQIDKSQFSYQNLKLLIYNLAH